MPIPSENQSQYSLYDVLIIGAGPSGLMMAQALGRLGIRVRIVERRIPGAQYGNADGLQPRTLEIWKSYGMLERIISKGACMHAMVGYERSSDGRGLVRTSPLNNIVAPSRYPFEVTASITDIEGTLAINAEEAGVHITHSSWPISLDIAQEDDSLARETEYPIKVTVEHSEVRPCDCRDAKMILANNNPKVCSCNIHEEIPPRTEIIYANYIIGADGAYSWVRRALGIEMEGEQTEDVWGVVDVLVDTDFPDCRFKCLIQATSGAIIIIPREGDKIRIYVQISAQDKIPRSSDGRLQKSALHEEEMRQKILSRAKEAFRPYRIEFTHVFWSTIFSTAQKVASKFSYKNRVFIMGDACHIHSPKAGQGANVSMGDAHNLTWKLAYVLRGWAGPSLLQTYEIERRTYALGLISFDRDVSMTLEGCAASDYQRLLHKQNLFTSGIGVNYSSSQLTFQTTHPACQIVPGERLPSYPITRLADWQTLDVHDLLVSDGLFKLLVFPGDLLLPNTRSNLHEFGEALTESVRNQHSRGSGNSSSRLAIYTIVRNQKEDVVWNEIPSSLVHSWRSCFGTGGDGEDLYKNFNISAPADSGGVLVLVRPDGYVSILSGLKREDARQTINFLYSL